MMEKLEEQKKVDCEMKMNTTLEFSASFTDVVAQVKLPCQGPDVRHGLI